MISRDHEEPRRVFLIPRFAEGIKRPRTLYQLAGQLSGPSTNVVAPRPMYVRPPEKPPETLERIQGFLHLSVTDQYYCLVLQYRHAHI